MSQENQVALPVSPLVVGHGAYSHFYLPKLRGRVDTDLVEADQQASIVVEEGDLLPQSTYFVKKIAVERRDFTNQDAGLIAEAIEASLGEHGAAACSCRAIEEVELGFNEQLTVDGVVRLLAALTMCTRAGAAGRLRRISLLGLQLDQTNSILHQALVELVTVSETVVTVELPVELSFREDVQRRAVLNAYPQALKFATIGAMDNNREVISIDLSAPPTEHDLDAVPPRLYTLEAIQAFAAALATCSTVAHLDFSNNCRGDDKIAALSEVLKTNTTLVTLMLRNNQIGNQGGLALVAALRVAKCQTPLAELHLQDNVVCNAVIDDLFQLIRDGDTNLGLVELERNCVEPAYVSRLHEALMLNTQPGQLKKLVPQLQQNNTTCTRVVCNSGLSLNNTSARVLMQALRPNNVVVHVDVSNNKIGDEGASYLAHIILDLKSLKRLIAQFNEITEIGARKILEAIPYSPLMELVDLKHQATPLLPETLESLELLSSLNRHPTDLRSKGILLLNDDPSLTTVHLGMFDGKRHCTNESVAVLAQLMKNNTHVKEVRLCNNELHVTATAMPLVASMCSRLTLLDLSNCRFFDEDILPYFGGILPTNTSLQTLMLERNRLTTETVRPFIGALRNHNSTLSRLSFAMNPDITPQEQEEVDFYCDLNKHSPAFKSIVLTIEANNNKTLKEVNLAVVGASVEGATSNVFKREFNDLSAKLVCIAMSQNDSVTKLNMSGNRITDDGAQYFSNMMKANTTLTHLDLSYNEITDAGLKVITHALHANHAIKVFVFKGNGSDPKVAQQINAALMSNSSSQVSVYSAAQTRHLTENAFLKKDAQLRQAQFDTMVEDAIFDDAMADFRVAERKKKLMAEQQ